MEDKIDSLSVSSEGIYPNQVTQRDRGTCPTPLKNVGESESSALLGLFFYSILMFTVPLGGFWFVKQYLEQNYNLGYTYNLLMPIIVAVVLVNFIIVLYVLRAFREDKKDHEQQNRPIEERKKLE